jgi:hypothetical protein
MHFLHLAVNFKNFWDLAAYKPTQEQIEAILNGANDWLRYAPNCWLIYTSQTADAWYQHLAKLPGMADNTYFISEVNLQNRAGWLKPTSWEWIHKNRNIS